LRRLEGGVELAGQLAVSPGGDRLAFTTFDYVRGGWSLRVMQLAHNHEREIAQDVGSSARPSWSPDGRWLAYTAYVNETSSYGVFVAAADNSRAPTRVAVVDAGYSWCIQPQWSPDGSELLYSAQDQIVAYQPSATQSRVVVAPGPGRRYCAAQWSPSGSEIAYSVIDDGSLDPADTIARLERAPRDGGAPSFIANLRGAITADQLRWRPDGQALAFVDYDAALNGAVLFQIGRDSGTAEIVDALDAGIGAGTPAWSPDGKTLLYVRFQEGARLSAFDLGSGGVSDLGIEGASIAGTYPAWLRQPPSQDL
jgi:Tol biopolymer transport system component